LELLQIPEGILSLPNLKRLNLGSNEIEEVSPLIERWAYLETLILSRNKVRIIWGVSITDSTEVRINQIADFCCPGNSQIF
jgi:Leucine-rich repeat (LRR) protein